MIRTVSGISLAVFLATAPIAARATAVATTPVEGLWRPAEGDGLVEIRPCGPRICGYLVDHDKLRADPAATDLMNPNPVKRHRPMMEMLLLDKFVGGPQDWSDGHIYNPENGKSYSGTLRLLDPTRLKVTGCLVRPLCGSQIWRRAKRGAP